MISPDAESREWMLERVRALQRALEELGAKEDTLDELVSDCLAEKASETNNAGIPAQLQLLLTSGWTPEDIINRVKMEMEEF
jgi:hypothetical protein